MNKDSLSIIPICLMLSLVFAQQFTEVAQELGVTDSINTMTMGVHWINVNNDGALDLYISNASYGIMPYRPHKNRLFINYLSDPIIFIDEAEDRGAEVLHGDSRATGWADYNLDGFIDFYVINGPGLFGSPDVPNEFYRNDGMEFTGIAANLGVDYMSSQYTGIAWGDYNNDGLPDMYVTRNQGANLLFRNDGDHFTDVATTLGIQDDSWHGNNHAVWGDYDEDGDPDLYLMVPAFNNKLFRNDLNETGQFVDVAMEVGVADSGLGRSAAWVDYDNDGDLDLFVINTVHEYEPITNRLYRNDNSLFTEVSFEVGLSDSVNGFTATWADYDNDGDQDLFIANYSIPNRLYRNDINVGGSFVEVGEEYGFDHDGIDLACAWGDYDDDGDMDLYVGNFRNDPDNSYNLLYRNNQDDQNYLKVRFLSANGSFSRYGSRIWVYYADTDSLTGMREVGGGYGRYIQNMYDIHFGLDGTQAYDIVIRSTVRINGANIVLDKTVKPELGGVVPINIGGFIEIRDTIDFILATDNNDPVVPENITLHQNYPNPFNSNTTIEYKLPYEAIVQITIYNLNGQAVKIFPLGALPAGEHAVIWDGADQGGALVSSGVYLYQLELSPGSGKHRLYTRKMVYLK